jgi:hypothetical protein
VPGRLIRKHLIPATLALVASGPALAYIDPGTGSLLVQGLIAGLAAAAVVARGYWYRIKGFFGRKKPEIPQPPPDGRPPGSPE